MEGTWNSEGQISRARDQVLIGKRIESRISSHAGGASDKARKGSLLQRWAKTLCTRLWVKTTAPLITRRTRPWSLDPECAQTHLSLESKAGRRAGKDWGCPCKAMCEGRARQLDAQGGVFLIGNAKNQDGCQMKLRSVMQSKDSGISSFFFSFPGILGNTFLFYSKDFSTSGRKGIDSWMSEITDARPTAA